MSERESFIHDLPRQPGQQTRIWRLVLPRRVAGPGAWILLVLALAFQAFAQSAYDFSLVNRTGRTLVNVAAAPAETGQWADNSIALKLENGQSASIRVTPNPGSFPEQWDLQLTWDDDSTAIIHDLRFENLSRLTVMRDAHGELTTLQE